MSQYVKKTAKANKISKKSYHDIISLGNKIDVKYGITKKSWSFIGAGLRLLAPSAVSWAVDSIREVFESKKEVSEICSRIVKILEEISTSENFKDHLSEINNFKEVVLVIGQASSAFGGINVFNEEALEYLKYFSDLCKSYLEFKDNALSIIGASKGALEIGKSMLSSLLTANIYRTDTEELEGLINVLGNKVQELKSSIDSKVQQISSQIAKQQVAAQRAVNQQPANKRQVSQAPTNQQDVEQNSEEDGDMDFLVS